MEETKDTEFKKEFDRLIEVISKNYTPDKIILFGSYARGDYHEGSDVDLVIIKDNVPDNFLRRLDEVIELFDGNIPVEVLVYKNDEVKKMLKRGNGFIRTVLEEGKVVYEK